MAERSPITSTVISRVVLFVKIGFYAFFMPYLEKRHGLRELFAILSSGKDRYRQDRNIIKKYVHAWIRIKSIFIAQHCWNRTLLLYKFLSSSGYHAVLSVGVRKDSLDKSSITGHSWITIDGSVFDDRADVAREYYVTFSYP